MLLDLIRVLIQFAVVYVLLGLFAGVYFVIKMNRSFQKDNLALSRKQAAGYYALGVAIWLPYFILWVLACVLRVDGAMPKLKR